ncbi:probable serine/threonine-protein kinase At1g09600 isoform X2 [Macadamia integrifolia]|uniref:probable serine/threonine-protein kinase At1g09600 isoform X2 n=1 Tax=Macadamia integrifolia TaxID=60698 RepID=UPI001C4E609A|nr:probable serine/threonine-protein kinase At1g09600 isoform X2 [Macadamia integrifolia]
MGCICSKGASSDQPAEVQREKESNKSSKRLVTPSKREAVVVETRSIGNGGSDGLALLKAPQQENSNSTPPIPTDKGEKKPLVVQPPPKGHHQRRATLDISTGRGQLPMSRIISISNGAAGEHAAAGWPSWLTAVAGEAIKGWAPRRADTFEKLDKIKCYMHQLLRGLEHCHSRGVLHRDIKGSNLLIDNNGNLKIADFGLATFFNPDNKQPLTSRVVTLWYRPPELLLGATDYGVAVDLWSAGCILAELLAGKPIMPGRTEVEQLHKIFKLCGSPSDEYWRKSKLPHATVFKPQQPYRRCLLETYKDFPSSALALLDVLLAVEPEDRGSAASALNSEFFTTKPLPCDPSSLPKYPPSKEFDAKLRDEEARKQKAAGKGRGHESTRRGSRDSRAVPAPDANAELQASLQKREGQSNPKISSEKYNPHEDGGSGFPIEPPRRVVPNGLSVSGQLNLPNGYGSSWSRVEGGETIGAPGRANGSSGKSAELRAQRSYMHQAAELSKFSSSVAVRNSSHVDSQRERSIQTNWPEQKLNSRYNQLDDAEPSEKSEWSHHLLDRPTSSQRKGEKVCGRESTMGYAPKKNRIHYSGPLLPPGGNIEEMLKEHERQIQQAVRKARLEKAKTKKNYGENGQSEALLRGTNGR